MAVYGFQNCFLDTREHSLRVNEKNVVLTSKTFDVLQLLVKKAGEIVTRSQILETVWKDQSVEEGNITIHISRIRKLLERKLGGENYRNGSRHWLSVFAVCKAD